MKRTVQHGGRNAHLRKLRGLVLHQRNQGRNYDRGLAEHKRGKLIAERLAAASWHHHASIVPAQQAPHNLLLQGTEGTVALILLKGGEEIGRGHGVSIEGGSGA